MTIIIGLGNPGAQYKNTRHNAGFIVLDKFAEKNNFPEFKLSKKFDTKISEGNFGGQEVLLAKPQTFMNNSGEAVKKIIKNYKIGKFIENLKLKIENYIVVHDDVDLLLEKIKIVKDRGSAGHKGIESIIKAIGNENLVRVRIGIAPEQSRSSDHRTEAKNVVLKKFSKEEIGIIQKSADALDFLLQNGLEKSMNEYNK